MGNPYRKPIFGPNQRWKLKKFWQKAGWLKVVLVLVVLTLIFVGYVSIMEPEEKIVEKVEVVKEQVVQERVVEKLVDAGLWHLKANTAVIVGGYRDNMDWKGKSLQATGGELVVRVDPYQDLGKIYSMFEAKVSPEEDKELDGQYEVYFADFREGKPWKQGGIAHRLRMFGASGRGDEWLPEIEADVAGWGIADVYLDGGELYDNLNAFFVYGDGVYSKNGVRDGDNLPYTEERAKASGFSDGKEAHLFLWSDVEDKRNYPDKAVFIHILYEDVDVKEQP
ncbi:MAG: hypothetical protein ACE5FT_01975 [Candidatus Nanoarchaeia archaeon]